MQNVLSKFKNLTDDTLTFIGPLHYAYEYIVFFLRYRVEKAARRSKSVQYYDIGSDLTTPHSDLSHGAIDFVPALN